MSPGYSSIIIKDQMLEESKRSQYSSMQIRPIDSSPHWRESSNKNNESTNIQEQTFQTRDMIGKINTSKT